METDFVMLYIHVERQHFFIKFNPYGNFIQGFFSKFRAGFSEHDITEYLKKLSIKV